MRKLLVAITLLLAACSGGKELTTPQAQAPTTTIKTPTARALIEGFKQSGLPVGMVVCFNDENDPTSF